MVVNFVEVFSDLGESSILGYLHLYGHFHVDLRVDADFYLSFYLHYSCGCQDHLPSHFPFDFFSAEIADAEGPVFVVFFEGVLDVLEISGGDHEYFFIGEVDEFGISSDYFILFFEFLDIVV